MYFSELARVKPSVAILESHDWILADSNTTGAILGAKPEREDDGAPYVSDRVSLTEATAS